MLLWGGLLLNLKLGQLKSLSANFQMNNYWHGNTLLLKRPPPKY